MNYIAYRTDDGKNAGKIRFYCKALEVSRQAFYDYLKRKKKPWKYQPLADAMLKIHAADEENANYGRIRMFQALQYQNEIGELGEITIPSEGTVRKIMEQIHLNHKPKRKPNGITKADREARKSDDLLKRDFTADAPLQKCVTDITEIPAKDGKLYVSAIFDCYDLLPVGLAVFHELLEQPQDLLGDWWYSTSCKTAKILRSGCRCPLRFIILVGNVSSVIDNFRNTF